MNDDWCLKYSGLRGYWSAFIPIPDSKDRKYVGGGQSKHEAIRKRDAGFIKYWGRVLTKEEWEAMKATS